MFFTELDYYGILNVSRCASKEEIALAYRKLAVKLCPFRDDVHNPCFTPLHEVSDQTHMTPINKERQWEYINMAYDVLGNELRRKVYDQYGEAGLFQGVVLPNGYFSPYQYHGDHMKVYKEVFGSYSPFANIMDALTNPPILYSDKEHGIGIKHRDPPVERIVYLDLEEVRFGCTKLMNVWRQEFVDSSQTKMEKRRTTLTLNIPPGATAGTRFCFKEEGDRSPTNIPSDIVFIIADKKHPIYERESHANLVHTREIDLCTALTGVRFTLPTLDNRTLKISITDVVTPDYVKIIPNEGLPQCKKIDSHETATSWKGNKSSADFGDLILKFKIKFPTYLTQNMRTRVKEFFATLKIMEMNALNEDNPMDAILEKLRD